jgi:uncharacterized membrane protein YhaH (DUF805 family)
MGLHITCPNPVCGVRLPSDLRRCPICRTPVNEHVVVEEALPGQATDPGPVYHDLGHVVRKVEALRGRATESLLAAERQSVALSVDHGEATGTTGGPARPVKEYGGISRLGYFQGRIVIGVVWLIVAFSARDMAARWGVATWEVTTAAWLAPAPAPAPGRPQAAVAPGASPALRGAALSGSAPATKNTPVPGSIRSDFAPIWLVSVLITGALIIITVLRLHNMGTSGWWSLLIFIPVVNIFLDLRCLAYPEGYSDHRRLDSAARVILLLTLGAIAIYAALLAVIEALSHSQ